MAMAHDDHPNDDSDSKNNQPTTTTKSLRQQIGRELAHVSDCINNNLVVARYATFSTVLLLGAYGIANTPLFYRYKHVLEIPSQMFQNRRWIHGRIIGVVGENERMMVRDHSSQSFQSSLSNSSKWATGSKDNKKDDSIHHDHHYRPILVLFRHSSPMERLLTQSAMERILTSSSTWKSSFPSYQNLLLIELAGISAPPPTSTTTTASSILSSTSLRNKSGPASTSPFPLLNQLVQQKTKVSLQLLARRRINPHDYIPAFAQRGNIHTNNLPVSDEDDGMKYTAICHLHYNHPSKSSWFKSTTNNASLEMVQSGQAWINPTGCVVAVVPLPQEVVGKHHSSTGKSTSSLLNFNPTVKQLRDDTHFLSQLEQAEYSSWKSKIGIWSSEDMRQLRMEYVAEEKSSSSSTKWQFWNIIKRGWERMVQRK